MTQVDKQDWLQAGINQLRELGPTGMSGEKLARRLDMTRGSFYHHFGSMDDYVRQLMDTWQQSYTLELLKKAQAADPLQEMALLMETAWNTDIELEIAVRQWGFSHPLVQARVEQIDRIRLTHISNLYATLLKDPDKGRKFGTIAYYGLLGALHSTPRKNKTALRELILEIQTLLLTEL